MLRWIALHEVTHAVHFGAAPWLREHLRGLATELLAGSRIGIGPADLAATARRLASKDPRRLLAEVWSSDPLTLLTPPDSRHLLESTQATMAAVEGFAEHVMDAAAPWLGEDVGELRLAMDRRREERPPLARLLSWLLGIELKLRQYRDGKRFCDGVVELDGIDALNAAWREPGGAADAGRAGRSRRLAAARRARPPLSLQRRFQPRSAADRSAGPDRRCVTAVTSGSVTPFASPCKNSCSVLC